MTNGFQPQQNFGAPPQFTQQQYAQPPAPQQAPPQFGGQPQTGGYFAQQQPAQGGQAAPQFQPPSQQAAPEVEDTEGYFAGGAAWISWDSDKGYVDGSIRGGLILGKRIVPQTDIDSGEIRYQKKGDTSKPLTMLVLTLQTAERADPDDDGRREMPIKSGLRTSAKQAFEAVGAKDLEVGGWFYAARIRKEPIPNSSFKRNIFDSVYARPGAPDPMHGQAPYQAPAPQPQMQQPAQFNPMAAQQSNGAASGFVPQAQGSIAAMPQQHAARIEGMYQQAMQMDPQLAAQAGYQLPQGAMNGQSMAPQPPYPPTEAYQAATGYPMVAQPQPSQGFVPDAQPQNGTVPPPTQQPGPPPQAQPGQWSPFTG